MINKVILVGHVGNKPESKVLDGSTDMVTNFSIATTERWKGKDGSKKEETQWHRVVAWRKLAEIIDKYVNKGSKIYIEGKLVHRSYEDKEGVKKYTTEVLARDMKMLDSKGSSVPVGDAPPASGESDDLPF